MKRSNDEVEENTASASSSGGSEPKNKQAKKDIVKKKFDPAAVDTPGFCTDPSQALSSLELELVVSGEDEGNKGISISCLLEKDLVGKGKMKLYKIVADGGETIKLCYYYDGKKCVKKDRLRIEAMVEAARRNRLDDDDVDDDVQAYVILAEHAGICKRNTLPELVMAGFVVQRVGVVDTE